MLNSTLVNVILQDIFYDVHLGALKAAILYQLLIFIILWLNRNKVVYSFKSLMLFDKIQHTKTVYIAKALIALVLFMVLRILEYYATIKL